MFVSTLFVAVVVLLVVQNWMRKRSASWKHLSKFSGNNPLPIIGDALQLGFDSDGATQKILNIWKKCGKTTFRMRVGSEDWVFLCEPEDVAVLYSDMSITSKSPERNAAVRPFFGCSVSTAEGDRWRFTRKTMLQSFQTKTLEQRLAAVNQRCDRLVEIFNGYVDKDPVPMYRYLRPFMFDVLCNTFMGIDACNLDNPDNPYMRESGKIIYTMTENYFSYWRNITFLFKLTATYREMQHTIKIVKDTGYEIMRKRREKLKAISDEIEINNLSADIDVEELLKNKVSEEHRLLDTLLFKTLPNGDPIPDEIINEEINFILFTGHYTTAITISHTLYCLAKHTEIQKLVIDEQRSIFNDDFLRKPTMEDLNKMKYLEAVIKETLRVVPTVPKIGRKLKKDLNMTDGRTIPAGTTVIVYYEALFQNDKVFSEPEKFKPERFFQDLHPSAFLAFGGGPRSCLGFRFAWVAVKGALSNLIRRFEAVSAGPEKEPDFSYRILTESKNDVHVKLKKRVVDELAT